MMDRTNSQSNPKNTERSVSGKNIPWKIIRDYAFILAGSLVQALAMRLFLVPGLLVSGGISGAAQLINHYTNWPIGVMVLIGNAPLFILGWRYLGKTLCVQNCICNSDVLCNDRWISLLYSASRNDQRPGAELIVWRFDAWGRVGIGVSGAGHERRE